MSRAEPNKLQPDRMALSPVPRPFGLSGQTLLLMLAASLLGLAVSGFVYWQYAQEWLRDPPKADRCVFLVARNLKNEDQVSGYEPHKTPSGETVWLRENEDRIVRCMGVISSEQAARVAEAYGIVEQGPRVSALAKIVVEGHPEDPESDRAAFNVYQASKGALIALPQSDPTVAAAIDEIDAFAACRWNTKEPCPSRPGIPVLVWVPGVPAALGLLFSCSALLLIGVRRRRRRKAAEKAARVKARAERRERRRRKKLAAATRAQPAQSAPPQSPSGE